MSDEPLGRRHLTPRTLDTLWAGDPMAIRIAGEPACQLRLDPFVGHLSLLTDYQYPEPDVARLKNVDIQAYSEDGKDLIKIVVNVERGVQSAYGFLAAIADELQIQKTPLAAAIDIAVRRHRSLVAERDTLTLEKELGLFGEILLLDYLIHAIGAGPAIAAWQGPHSEEHDFVFDDCRAEVKTTSSERRSHMINGLSQLVPVAGSALYLVSIQLTRSTTAGGHSLPALISRTRSAAGRHVVAFDRCLDRLGWSSEDCDLYPDEWVLRSSPRGYAVTGDFPAITPARLRSAVPDFTLISDISYRIDLTNYSYNDVAAPLSGFVESKEN